jgi:hypothetical protein
VEERESLPNLSEGKSQFYWIDLVDNIIYFRIRLTETVEVSSNAPFGMDSSQTSQVMMDTIIPSSTSNAPREMKPLEPSTPTPSKSTPATPVTSQPPQQQPSTPMNGESNKEKRKLSPSGEQQPSKKKKSSKKDKKKKRYQEEEVSKAQPPISSQPTNQVLFLCKLMMQASILCQGNCFFNNSKGNHAYCTTSSSAKDIISTIIFSNIGQQDCAYIGS